MPNETKTTDQIVLELLEKIQSKKAEIKSIERPQWKTSTTLGLDESSPNRTNLQVETDVSRLVGLHAFLSAKKDYYEQSRLELGVSGKFKWMAYSFEDWDADIRTRISQLEIKNKKAELDGLEARIDRLISPEQRRELELKALQYELSRV